MSETINIAVSNHQTSMRPAKKLGLGFVGILVLILISSFTTNLNGWWLTGLIVSFLGAGACFAVDQLSVSPSEKNHGLYLNSLTNKGALAWLLGIVLTGFYIELYWYPEWLGMGTGANGANEGLIRLFDPLSQLFKNKPASQWFVYGTLYTTVILSLGVKFIAKYRNNNYQRIRTIVVIVSQLGLAYLIPEILEGLNYNSVTANDVYLGWFDTDIKNTWPLDYDFFHSWHLDAMQQEAYQPVGMIYLIVGVLMFLVVTPIITYFVGKRWYCSWICGCGGLAETAGDSFRHLSSKKLSAWKLERWLIYPIMIWVLLMTIASIYGYLANSGTFLGLDVYQWWQKPYGFVIGAAFSGVVGVGFYPILGNRIWCRMGCPMAGYLGLFQRFKSRFRITTNGSQCISCGNCSTQCEQGIDVRWYAQRGENIVRSSCVGCGVCADVCPRGVLNLENGPEENRISNGPINIGKDKITLDL